VLSRLDLDDNRLEVAKRFGAMSTINSSVGDTADAVLKMTGRRGVDTLNFASPEIAFTLPDHREDELGFSRSPLGIIWSHQWRGRSFVVCLYRLPARVLSALRLQPRHRWLQRTLSTGGRTQCRLLKLLNAVDDIEHDLGLSQIGG